MFFDNYNKIYFKFCPEKITYSFENKLFQCLVAQQSGMSVYPGTNTNELYTLFVLRQ